MPEKKTDLRVIKTKKAIYDALVKLLHKKSIDRITVAELAQEAMINKGTFYLHYTDIFDLFQQALQHHMQEIADLIDFTDLIFTDPDAFAQKLVSFSREKPLFADDVFLQEGNRTYCQSAQSFLCDALVAKTLTDTPQQLSASDSAKLRFIFSGTGSLMRYDAASSHEELAEIISTAIKALL